MGSIPFGFILTKIFLKKDIRDIGSANIGTTNVLRTGNKSLGYGTLFLDIIKAIIPVVYVKLNYPDLTEYYFSPSVIEKIDDLPQIDNFLSNWEIFA